MRRRRPNRRSISVQGAARQGAGQACPPARSSSAALKAELAQGHAGAGQRQGRKATRWRREAPGLRQKLIDTAARIESLEREKIDARCADRPAGRRRMTQLTAGFARDRISVTGCLAILERLQHDMPPALAVRPDDALAAARGAMLVGATPAAGLCPGRRAGAPHRRARSARAWRWSARRAEAADTAAAPDHRAQPIWTTLLGPERARSRGRRRTTTATSRPGWTEIAAKAADFQALVTRVAALRRSRAVRPNTAWSP